MGQGWQCLSKSRAKGQVMPLKVKTTALKHAPVLELGGKSVFLRSGSQLIGEGVAHIISATGENRIQELSSAWKALCETAQIDDEVKLAGSGLVAFTSITFSPLSTRPSLLIIPRRLTVIREGIAFETVVETDSTELAANLVAPEGKLEEGSQSSGGFLKSVELAVEQISDTDLAKVVLSRDLVMPISGPPDLSKALTRLSARYPHCWTYSVGEVFGASPELLLRAESGEVSARVLAGTAARGTDPDVDRAIAEGLAHSIKNKQEHAFAVDSLLEKLGLFCDQVTADKEPFSLALPDLWHLATDVTGKLKAKISLLDIVSQLHPTAAVAGTPRQLAQELIAKLEPFDRGGYAGPVGWLASDGSGELAIALRGGIIEENQIRAIAGGGIVSGSDPQAELAETELKFRAVRYAFYS
jgi:menaquinone-specific isochorismate synthase